jgi:hypothetical protein
MNFGETAAWRPFCFMLPVGVMALGLKIAESFLLRANEVIE